MLCELCKQNDAECVLHRKDANGEDEELYVCKKCLAAAEGSSGTRAEGDAPVKFKPTIITADGEPPPEFIQNFLDAAVGLIEGVVKSDRLPEEPKCRVCGSTWSKIKQARELGCPDCWSQFAKEIKKEFLCGSYGPKHVGKIPEKNSDGRPSRAFLEKELKEAVAKQNYRKAARIRKQLDDLNEGGI